MPATIKNHMLIDKYLEQAKALHSEPMEDVIFASFIRCAEHPAVDFKIPSKKQKKTLKKNRVLYKEG